MQTSNGTCRAPTANLPNGYFLLAWENVNVQNFPAIQTTNFKYSSVLDSCGFSLYTTSYSCVFFYSSVFHSCVPNRPYREKLVSENPKLMQPGPQLFRRERDNSMNNDTTVHENSTRNISASRHLDEQRVSKVHAYKSTTSLAFTPIVRQQNLLSTPTGSTRAYAYTVGWYYAGGNMT